MSDTHDGHDFIKWQNRCSRCGMPYSGQDGWIVTHAKCPKPEPSHGGIRFIYPVQELPSSPIVLTVAHADGHCERFHSTDEVLFHLVTEIMGMLRANMSARGKL